MPAPTTILVVEDDREIRESIIDALEDEGHQVLSAADGQLALECLQNDLIALPALILLDLTMPRLDGIQFGAVVAKHDLWSVIPIVVLSADVEIRTKANACGAIGYLKKPVKLRDLYCTISRVLDPVRS